MKELMLCIKGRKYNAKNPTVGDLKKFLEFKQAYEKTKELDKDTLYLLLSLTKSIFPKTGDRQINAIKASELIKLAEDIAKWLGASLGSAEKNS